MDQTMNVPPTEKCCGTCSHVGIYNLAYKSGIKCYFSSARGKEKNPGDVCINHEWTNPSLKAEYVDGLLKLAEKELYPVASPSPGAPCAGCIFVNCDQDGPCVSGDKTFIWKTAGADWASIGNMLDALEYAPDKIAAIRQSKLSRSQGK